MSEHFADAGFSAMPELSKWESKGGSGLYTRYRLRFRRPSGSEDETPTEPSSKPATGARSAAVAAPQPKPLLVRYYTESVTTNRFLAWMGTSGILLSGWQTSVVATAFFFGMLAVIALGMYIWFAVTSAGSTLALLRLLLISAVIAGIVWRSFRWFPELSRNRIAITPSFVQGLSAHEDRVLELCRDDDAQANRITLRRYMAECPICKGTVRVSPGRVQFPGRLVGRCGNAPTEHVFSFDPITRDGVYLHWPHPYDQGFR